MKKQALKSVLQSLQPKKDNMKTECVSPEVEQKIHLHFPVNKIPEGLTVENSKIGSVLKLQISGIVTSIDTYGISLDIETVNAIQNKESGQSDKSDTDEE